MLSGRAFPGLEKFSGTLLPSRATCFLIFLIFCCPVNVGGCPNKNTGFSGALPPYAESWLEACLSVTPATRREGSAPANAESRSGHGIMVPGRACSALQFSDFCCPGRQTGCLRALGHPIFLGLIPVIYNPQAEETFPGVGVKPLFR